MVDETGYIKLINIETAKNLKDNFRTYTIIGTPHYMAPEILKGKGYAHSVDLWSTGICMFEFMCGEFPFGEEVDDPYDIFEEIMKKNLAFPEFVNDSRGKKLLE